MGPRRGEVRTLLRRLRLIVVEPMLVRLEYRSSRYDHTGCNGANGTTSCLRLDTCSRLSARMLILRFARRVAEEGAVACSFTDDRTLRLPRRWRSWMGSSRGGGSLNLAARLLRSQFGRRDHSNSWLPI